MSIPMMNEALAALFCLLISWSFAIWFVYEWRTNELGRKNPPVVFFALVLVVLVTVAGSILPAYFAAKCYYHNVLGNLLTSNVKQITVGDTVITEGLSPIVTALKDSEWFVPSEQVGWAKLVREGGMPMVIEQKEGPTYKFQIGYYFLGETLIRFPTGGYALSRNLAKALDDVNAPLP